MTIIELARLSEDDARLYLERIVWPNGPTCPHCKTQHVTWSDSCISGKRIQT